MSKYRLFPGWGFDERSLRGLLNDLPLCEEEVWIAWSLGGLEALQLAQTSPPAVLVLIATSPKFVSDQNWPGVDPYVFDRFKGEVNRDPASALNRFAYFQNQLVGDENAKDAGVKETTQKSARELYLWAKEHLALDTPCERLLEGLRRLQETDCRGQYPACHALLILGERDPLIPIEIATLMAEQWPHLQIEKIKGAGHLPFVSDREEVLTLIRSAVLHAS